MAEFVNTVDVIGDDALTDSIINKTITELYDNTLAKIGDYAFYVCKALTTADFPLVTSIGDSAFYGCSTLTSVNFPATTSISDTAFNGCSALTSVNLPAATRIASHVFNSCRALTTLILRNTEKVATLGSTSTFSSTPIQSGTGYIYVPRDLVDSYKSATNWSTYANQFRALEDWTVDGTTTGELDVANRRMVRFFNSDGTLLGYKVVTVGSAAVYDGTPVCPEDSSWEFKGFLPEPTNVTEDMDCYAQFRNPAIVSAKMMEGSITEYADDQAERVGDYAFYYCSALTSVNLPAATSVGKSAFYGCSALTSVNLPAATSIGDGAFGDCSKITTFDFPSVTSIAASALSGCSAITALIIRNTDTVCTIDVNNLGNAFYKGTGYIYVPSSLVDSYKSATNWSTRAAQIRAIEDYPEICGGE